MPMILVELVPRDRDEVQTLAKTIKNDYSQISGFNIPDVMRLTTRSYDCASDFLSSGLTVIPHFRAIDMPIDESLKVIGSLVKKGLKHILIITGDPPPSFKHKTYKVSAPELIRHVKQAFPDLLVYGALDPYRQSFKRELEYCHDKERAGADGFFTQPFFDVELARIYMEQIEKPFFIGVSPVIKERSVNYWINRNNAIFPHSFELSLEYNAKLARDFIDLATRFKQNLYFMPITVDPVTYLEAVFSE